MSVAGGGGGDDGTAKKRVLVPVADGSEGEWE